MSKEYICKEEMAINLTCEIPRKDGDYQDGFSDAIRLIISRFQNLHAVTKADICREFANRLRKLLIDMECMEDAIMALDEKLAEMESENG